MGNDRSAGSFLLQLTRLGRSANDAVYAALASPDHDSSPAIDAKLFIEGRDVIANSVRGQLQLLADFRITGAPADKGDNVAFAPGEIPELQRG